MTSRQRQHQESEQREAPAEEPPAEGLDAVRAEVERFLAAGDDAIERALSGDSIDFLDSTRQEGGQ